MNEQKADLLRKEIDIAISKLESAKSNLSHYGSMRDFNIFLLNAKSRIEEIHSKTKGTF